MKRSLIFSLILIIGFLFSSNTAFGMKQLKRVFKTDKTVRTYNLLSRCPSGTCDAQVISYGIFRGTHDNAKKELKALERRLTRSSGNVCLHQHTRHCQSNQPHKFYLEEVPEAATPPPSP